MTIPGRSHRKHRSPNEQRSGRKTEKQSDLKSVKQRRSNDKTSIKRSNHA